MADNRESPQSSTPGWLFFVVGALVVAVFILGYFWFESGNGDDVNFTVEVPTESTGGDQGTAGGGQGAAGGGGEATGGAQGNTSGTSN